jgi:hypothetical protein
VHSCKDNERDWTLKRSNRSNKLCLRALGGNGGNKASGCFPGCDNPAESAGITDLPAATVKMEQPVQSALNK